MKYLKITAENYNEAMKKLRTEHGDEAIPISHKYVKQGGLFKSRMFAKEVVELTAAVKDRRPFPGKAMKKSTVDFTVDDKTENSKLGKVQEILDRAASGNSGFSMDSINKSIDSFNSSMDTLKNAENSNTKKNHDQISEPVIVSENQGSDIFDSGSSQFKNIECEVNDIKNTLNRLIDSRANDVPGKRNNESNGELGQYHDILRSNDFDAEECDLIIREVKNSISREDLKDKYKVEKSLKDLIKSRIVTSGPIKKGNRKKIVMFIGPTGVGKTTTMAKLGAINSLREGNKVSFITIDNYRIAATEQLKKYAEIMRIPIHVVNDQKGFREVISKEKSDLIMVDTSGRSHNNELKISEIKSFADTVEYDFEKVLCVSASTKKGDLINIFKSFDVMQFDSVIITKVDETSFIGNVIDVADKYNKPISYFTDGQEVPNNIHIADPDGIADMIIRDSVE